MLYDYSGLIYDLENMNGTSVGGLLHGEEEDHDGDFCQQMAQSI